MRLDSPLKRLTDCAVEMHGAVAYDRLACVTVEAMAGLIDSDWATLSFAPSISPAPLTPRLWSSNHAADWEGLATHGRSLAADDPVYTDRLRLQREGPAAYSDYMTRAEFERSRVYNEVWRPAGAKQVLAYLNPGRLGFRLVLGRAGSRGFTTGDAEMLHALGRHLDAAATRLAAEHDGRVPVDGRLVPVSTALWLVCNRDGKVLRWMPGARELIRRCLGAEVPTDRLTGAWLSVLRRRARGAPSEPLEHHSRGARITVYISPIAGSPDEFSVYFVIDPAADDPVSGLLNMGLTRRQAEVLRWTAEGKTGPEIAVILGVSVLTVKKHMEHVRRRLGVGTRAAAAAVALRATHGRS